MIFFATSAANQQDLIKEELRRCEIDQIKIGPGGVEFVADLEKAYRFTMTSRITSRVLQALYFDEDIQSADELYQSSLSIPWEEYLSPDKKFLITETVKKCSWLNNSHFAALRIKDAIVDRIKERFDGNRPDVDSDNPDITFHVHIKENKVIWYVDFSGQGLSKRGYRTDQSEAVMKESLASALIYRSQWYKSYKEGILLPLYDPFCGSGTISIEAAMIAREIAPALIKKDQYAFTRLSSFDEEIYQKVLASLVEKRKEAENKDILIKAGDISRNNVEIAKACALKAGVYDDIIFEVKDFTTFDEDDRFDEAEGAIITDPPYGVRLKNLDLTTLYSKTGEILSTFFKGWHVAILAGDQELLSYIDMKPERTNSVYNGNIACQIAHYKVYTDEEKEILIQKALERKKERLAKELPPGAQMAYNRIIKNLEILKPLMEKEGITSYRIYDKDMPEYAAAIDLYENKWINLAEYAPPKTIEPEAARKRLDELILAVERATGIDLENIYVKQRKEMKGTDQYNKLASSNKFYIMRENGVKCLVNFTDYLDTGIFLDHRPIRKFIQESSSNKRFLNLFCYTGTATLNAIKGGSLSTVSVDSSSTYLDWAMENLKINQYNTNMENLFYKSDVIEYLYSTYDKFDLIFCDPPTFSNSKDRESFDVQKDHYNLINLIMLHLEKNGTLIFSNNFRKFKMDERIYEKYKVENISDKTIAEDFSRNEKIHQCYLIKHKIKIELQTRKKPVIKNM